MDLAPAQAIVGYAFDVLPPCHLIGDRLLALALALATLWIGDRLLADLCIGDRFLASALATLWRERLLVLDVRLLATLGIERLLATLCRVATPLLAFLWMERRKN